MSTWLSNSATTNLNQCSLFHLARVQDRMRSSRCHRRRWREEGRVRWLYWRLSWPETLMRRICPTRDPRPKRASSATTESLRLLSMDDPEVFHRWLDIRKPHLHIWKNGKTIKHSSGVMPYNTNKAWNRYKLRYQHWMNDELGRIGFNDTRSGFQTINMGEVCAGF